MLQLPANDDETFYHGGNVEMTSIETKPLAEDLPFGARISGITLERLQDENVRSEIRAVFEDRGVIIFEDVEQSNEMQLALSNIFGPLQDHAYRGIPKVDKDAMPGVIDLNYKGNLFEVDGKQLYGYVPWHFDACYTAKLNRGGVLRGVDLPPEGGLTGFADGVQLYRAISPELRERFESLQILYHPKLMFMNQCFGLPKKYRVLSLPESAVTMMELAEDAPRSIHPAVWTRKSGEKVLHVSPWQAAGIHGHEDEAGDALLEALCQEMYAKMAPYWHTWKPTDMVTWDNWRFLHAVSGNDPRYSRRMHRTTIEGDYGLGRFEDETKTEQLVGFDV